MVVLDRRVSHCSRCLIPTTIWVVLVMWCAATFTNAFVVVTTAPLAPSRGPRSKIGSSRTTSRGPTNHHPGFALAGVVAGKDHEETAAVAAATQSTPPQDLDDNREKNDSAGVLDASEGVAPGSPEELMYTLGVNLARQLGDVRPLVEDGRELAQMAKGLLDTVIGRLSEEGQRQLLQRRGAELNQLITDRA